MVDLIHPKVLIVIPVRGIDAEDEKGPLMLGGKPLISYTIEAALACSSAQRVVCPPIANLCKNCLYNWEQRHLS